MSDHQKPTKEELEQQIKESQAKLEKEAEEIASPSIEAPSEEIPSPSEEVPSPSVEAPAPSEEIKPEEKPEEKEEANTQAKEDNSRLIASQREALILNARQKKMNEAIAAADSLPEPTLEDLEKEALQKGFTYDEMTSVEKSLFKTSVINERKLSVISEVAKEGKDIDQWNAKVDEFIDDPKTLVDNPKLEGKADEFKLFAAKQSRRGVPFDVLVSAFLFDETTKAPPKKSGEMFPSGTVGRAEKEKVVSDKLTAAQGRQLMQTDYRKYMTLLKAGKIENE